MPQHGVKVLSGRLRTTGYTQRAWQRCGNATMVPHYNALLAYRAVQLLNRWRVAGDIVEMGVWRGGSQVGRGHRTFSAAWPTAVCNQLEPR